MFVRLKHAWRHAEPKVGQAETSITTKGRPRSLFD
jgi:hypothetical protein